MPRFYFFIPFCLIALGCGVRRDPIPYIEAQRRAEATREGAPKNLEAEAPSPVPAPTPTAPTRGKRR